MNLADITPVLLTFNEAANLERSLAALSWASRIIVVDSGSDDATLDIFHRDPRISVFHRPFDGQASQWTYALTQTDAETEWIMALDADYVLSDSLKDELAELQPSADVSGYRAHFRYCVAGRPLRGSLYPPVTVLYRRCSAHYIQDGHTQRVVVSGVIGDLCAPIFHDDRKPLGHWLRSQLRYAEQEAETLISAGPSKQGWAARIRRWYLGPFLVLPYCLLYKGLALDGIYGLRYTLERLCFEILLALHLLDAYMRRRTVAPSQENN